MAIKPSFARVSVIIVNFNSGNWLSRCVRSVVASTLPVEIYVADNDSTDDSMSVLAREFGDLGNLHLRRNTSNLGFAKAVNRLIDEAKPHSDWVVLLNPDCEIETDTLEKIFHVLEENPRAGMAGGLIVNPDGTEQYGCRRRIPDIKSAAMQSLGLNRNNPDETESSMSALPQTVEAISGAFMFVRCSALETVGLLDEGYFMHCEDLDWCLRFTRSGWQILFVSGARIVHAKGVCSSTHQLKVEWWKHRGMLRFWRKFYGKGPKSIFLIFLVPAVSARFLVSSMKILTKRFIKRIEAWRTEES